MTSNFHRWKVDPFFSAAEEVQDSADRLESVYRAWIHAKSADTGANESVVIEYRRRELSTALGTAKWQLEEFERAVSYLDTDEQRGAADDAPTRHKQFVDALQKQINSIEKSLLNSGDSRDLKVLPVVHLGQEEKDDLAIFLCGSRVNLHEDIKKTGVCASSTHLNRIGNEETSSESVKSKNEVSDCFSTTASTPDTALSKVDFQSGLKRWKDGDADSKDHSLTLKLTDLEKLIGETPTCYTSYAAAGGVSCKNVAVFKVCFFYQPGCAQSGCDCCGLGVCRSYFRSCDIIGSLTGMHISMSGIQNEP